MFVRANRTLILAVSVIATALFGTSGAQAATETDTFDVTATIVASCTIAAGDLAFGPYDPLAGTALDGTATISVTCSNGAGYSIQLNGGSVANDIVARTMVRSGPPANTLNYSLFRDALRAENWGNTDASDTVAGTGTGVAQSITVYGRIPSGQTTPTTGSYADTVTATIVY